jgi:hypothetical protein
MLAKETNSEERHVIDMRGGIEYNNFLVFPPY